MKIQISLSSKLNLRSVAKHVLELIPELGVVAAKNGIDSVKNTILFDTGKQHDNTLRDTLVSEIIFKKRRKIAAASNNNFAAFSSMDKKSGNLLIGIQFEELK